MVTRVFTYENKTIMNIQTLTKFFEEKDKALLAMDEMDDDEIYDENNSNEMIDSNILYEGSNIFVISYRSQTSFSKKMSMQFHQLSDYFQ